MPPDIDGMFTFGKFMGIILKFTLSFGLIFELPMVSFVLAKIGIVKYTFMAKYRGYALVIVFIISAVITPTVDPVSQTLMAIPLYLLYEVSILVARFAGKNTLM
jgi:sec-independent protein translocase protein TatC